MEYHTQEGNKRLHVTQCGLILAISMSGESELEVL